MTKSNPEYAKLKKGDVFVLERGEYSDRSWSALRALADFDLSEAGKVYVRSMPMDEYGFVDFDSPDFHAWIVKNGWAEDAKDVRTFHCGSYGHFDLRW